MERDSRKAIEGEGFDWGRDFMEAEIRGRIRGMIQVRFGDGAPRVASIGEVDL